VEDPKARRHVPTGNPHSSHSKRSRAAITPPAQAADLIGHLPATGVSLIYDPASHVLRTGSKDAIPSASADNTTPRTEGGITSKRSTRRSQDRARVTFKPA